MFLPLSHDIKLIQSRIKSNILKLVLQNANSFLNILYDITIHVG